MNRTRNPRHPRQRGATLIEVLVSMVILMVGLLGLIGVMIQGQRAHIESYQRSQALMLVQDMVARISSNRAAADCYEVADTLGTDQDTESIDVAACTVGSAAQKARAQQDLRDWNELLRGSAEVSDDVQVGAMLSARGCIVKGADGVFLVSIAWQGVEGAGAPPDSIPCGSGTYGDNERNRRAVAMTVFPYMAL